MNVECTKCESTKIFKASKQIVTYKNTSGRRGNRMKIVKPRYHCLDCNHRFDTVKHGVIHY